MNSTLALQKSDYEREVGDFLGWGKRIETSSDSAWVEKTKAKIKLDVASGLRRFYFCGHPWSFLKPFAQVTIPEDVTTVTLPDDFGGVDGGTQASLTNTNLIFLRWMPFTGPGRIIQALAETPSSTGMPRMVAIRPIKAIVPGRMQQSELLFFPTTDREYTLTFPYFVTPNYLLDVTQPYAYGGVDHHETILESCLAIAEARRDNAMGLHGAEFQRLLQLSIQIDRRKNPTNLGQNYDRSDAGNLWDSWNGHGMNNDGMGGVTINGVYYN